MDNNQREMELDEYRQNTTGDKVDYSLLEGLNKNARRTKEEIESLRPNPDPLDDEVAELLDRLWLVTRKSEDQTGDRKTDLISHWVDMLGEKHSVDITKRALKHLIRTQEFFPAPVKFHQIYRTFDYDRNGY